MARMASRPRQVQVLYRGIPYMLDLVACRRALVARQVEGKLDSMQSLAQAVGVSRSTASRFFSGRPTSLAVTLKTLAALGLKFDEVAKPVADDPEGGDDPDGSAGTVGARRSPGGPRPGGVDGPGWRAAAGA